MSETMEVKPGYTPDDVAALIETLRGMVDLEEGELYTLRQGKLHHVTPRDEENGLRRLKVMEEAYDAGQRVARRLRPRMRGYRPDPALVVSAFVMHAVTLPPEQADAIALAYLQRLFTRASPAPGEDAASPSDAVSDAETGEKAVPAIRPAGGQARHARRAPAAT